MYAALGPLRTADALGALDRVHAYHPLATAVPEAAKEPEAAISVSSETIGPQSSVNQATTSVPHPQQAVSGQRARDVADDDGATGIGGDEVLWGGQHLQCPPPPWDLAL